MASKFGAATTVEQPKTSKFGASSVVEELPIGALGASFVEPAGTLITGAIAEPIAGLAGIAGGLLPGEEGQGQRAIEATREALTFQPRTQAGQAGLQAVGQALAPVGEALQAVETGLGEAAFEAGPETIAPQVRAGVAAAATTLPTAALELLGLRLGKQLSKIPARKGKQLEAEAERLSSEAEELAKPRPTDFGLQESANIIQGGTPEEIRALVQADPEFFKAADELGISTEPLASFASQNPQFRAIEQGLSSIPASQLEVQSKAFIGEISQKADNIIEEFGGTLDKASLSERFRSESKKTIDNIYDNERTVYNNIDKALPRNTRIPPTNTVNYIQGLASELGGVEFLPARFKKLLNEIRPKTKTRPGAFSPVLGKAPPVVEEILPTFGLLNTRRSEVGQQLGRKGNTQFKDIEKGQLKGLYGAMKRDQDAIAKQFSTPENNLNTLTNIADGLTIQRKQIEDNLTSLLGKDLSRDLLPLVGQKVKGLAQGKVQSFNETLTKIPENLRGSVVISAFNDVFKGTGVNQQALNPTQFAKFMNSLDRSPTAKRSLFKHLTPESRKSIENLTTLNRGISRALQDKVTTGRISAFFEQNNTLMNNLMGKAASLASVKAGGPLAGTVVSEFLNQSSDAAKAANKMMASTQFQRIIRESVKEGVIDGTQVSRKLENAAKTFEKSKAFRDWEQLLAESEKLKLANVGLIGYLFGEEIQE